MGGVWQTLAAGVRRHTGGGRGMSNTVLAKLAHLIGAGENFSGVYAADCIPVARLKTKSKFVLIVNLGRRLSPRERGRVGHFVAIIAEPDRLSYIDSYGEVCLQPDVLRFLAACGRPVSFNVRKIQSENSLACGLYALLYAVYFGRGLRFTLRFSKTRLAGNDAKCVRYLQKIALGNIG